MHNTVHSTPAPCLLHACSVPALRLLRTCSVACSYTIQYTIQCTAQYTVQYTALYTVQYTVQCTVQYSEKQRPSKQTVAVSIRSGQKTQTSHHTYCSNGRTLISKLASKTCAHRCSFMVGFPTLRPSHWSLGPIVWSFVCKLPIGRLWLVAGRVHLCLIVGG